MSGSLGLNTLAMPGISPTAPTNALAPAMPAAPPAGSQFDPVAAQQWLLSQQPVGAGVTPQTGQQAQQLTPQQQFAALMQYYQAQQAAQSQQQAAQAKALQDQQAYWQSYDRGGEGGGEGGGGGGGGGVEGTM